VCFCCDALQGIPSLGELKLRYYQLMITYHQHYHSYLEICRCYKAIYESEGVQDDPAVWGPVSVRLDFFLAGYCFQAVLQ
jgi:26S proteasome regulatory subunit N5